jgi:FkbM family methyltransferase
MMSTAAKVRIARMLYLVVRLVRWPLGASDVVRTKRRGIEWALDLREGIDLTIYLRGAFEPDTLRALEGLVRPGDTVLDIGANVGAHTLHLARLVGVRGQVIAFEPTDFAIGKLRANLKVNPGLEPRVVLHQVFLAAVSSAVLVAPVAASWPVDGTRPDDAATASCSMSSAGARATSLDSEMASHGDPTVHLIKMDVDGHELEVLAGARKLLEKHAPVLVMELAPFVFQPESKFDAMVELLTLHGYTLRTLGSRRPLPRALLELKQLIPLGGSVNIWATRSASAAPPAGRSA